MTTLAENRDRGMNGISLDDTRRFPNLSLEDFDAFRNGNFCPFCGWRRATAEAQMITPQCPSCGASWAHTSAAVGGEPPDMIDDENMLGRLAYANTIDEWLAAKLAEYYER